ncbi:MAG: glycosyltransferase [Bacteroidales bacterium]|nr:glycosyltransferase [Lachnoclostridium sp.]MCM1383629.1 glycosyltransferase [Lachnoclostridium sp.]MCM1465711.1 glycosyltransferase [Bacteroidales bacterium]
MKKILVVMNTMGQAGAETALLELLRHINPAEYEVSLYVLMAQGEMVHELPDYVKLLNARYDDSSVLGREGRAHMRRTVLKAMFARATVFRLFPYLIKNLAAMAAKGKILTDKLLWRVLSDSGQRFKEHYDLAVAYLEGGSAYYVADHVEAVRKAAFLHVDYGRAGYTRELDRNCYLKFDRVFCVSKEVREAFLQVYPECGPKSEVFHNLVNQDAIRQKAKLSGGFTDDYEGFRILTVGRLTAQKAFEVSIEAMKLLKEKGIRARWYVLGEGDQRSFLEEKIRHFHLEEDFLLLGASKNPYPYMAQADIYVHASRFEGKSIAIQEAQTLGCAILVSDCSGNREQVIPGVDGMMCGFTPEEICRDIQTLLQDESLRSRLGRAAAQKKLTDESEVEKLLRLAN